MDKQITKQWAKKVGGLTWKAAKTAQSKIRQQLSWREQALNTPQWQCHASTHVGKVRKNNEDAYYIAELAQGAVLMLVADGVGGQNAGEVASRMVCDTFAHYVAENAFETVLNTPQTTAAVLKVITHEAHRAIALNAKANPSRKGMASTLIAAVVYENVVTWIQVGDSRLYHLSQGQLNQISTDQTVARALFETGRIDQAALAKHPQRNVLEFAMGLETPEAPIEPRSGHFTLALGDSLLLCSDGVTDMINDAQLQHTLLDQTALKTTVASITKQALNNGGKDNTTLVLAQRLNTEQTAESEQTHG